MQPTPLSDILSAMRPGLSPHHRVSDFYPDWSQGRTSFGGLTAAQAVHALRQTCEAERPLRSLMVSFISAAGPGEIDIHCAELHRGNSATWAEARVSQAGKLIATVTAFYGTSRDSAIAVTAATRPDCPGPDQAAHVMAADNPLMPAFTRNYQMRFAIGAAPASASPNSELGAWVRYHDEPNPLSEAQLVAMLDLPPPAVMQMFKQPKPVSSLAWHIEFLDHLNSADSRDSTGWWFMHARAKATGDGYSQEHTTLYTPSGRALAMSQQTVAIYA